VSVLSRNRRDRHTHRLDQAFAGSGLGFPQ
jgi:hypothetical protein